MLSFMFSIIIIYQNRIFKNSVTFQNIAIYSRYITNIKNFQIIQLFYSINHICKITLLQTYDKSVEFYYSSYENTIILQIFIIV